MFECRLCFCSFDQLMVSAADDLSNRDDWKVFHREMEAQFYFHCGTAVLNKALKVRPVLHCNNSLFLHLTTTLCSGLEVKKEYYQNCFIFPICYLFN